jgi:5-methyltetrahydropteroyltriglutamate--homocysteine methyltransferase
MNKSSYTFYVRHRVKGIGMNAAAAEKGRQIMVGLDQLDHPDFMERMTHFRGIDFPACIGPLSYEDKKPLERDLAHLAAAAAKSGPVEVFMTAPSPGILTRFVIDTHYKNEDAYVEALAAVMRTEYQAIIKAGFLLQIDCPDLGSARHNQYRDKTEDEFRRIAGRNIAALNAATESLPGERMRLHICWGNYEGPHDFDIPLRKILPIILKGKPQAISFEASNPRHAHEWTVWREAKLPDDKVLIPGVIDTCTNYIEHPELVAQRICRFADVVGRERVMAGTDCGFATSVGTAGRVDREIAFRKLGSLVEGAQIASKRLWG